MSDYEHRFSRDADLLLRGDRPPDWDNLDDDYHQLLTLGERITERRYMRPRLRQQETHNMKFIKQHWQAAAIILLVMITLAVAGPALADAIIGTFNLGSGTRVEVVGDDRFQVVTDEDGNTSILTGEDVNPEELLEEDGEDVFTDIATMQGQVDFTLAEPRYLPEGYTFDNSFIIDGDTVVLEYVTATGDWLSLAQEPGENTIVVSEDVGVTEILINGIDGLWIQMMDEHILLWEVDGISYELNIHGLDFDTALRIAESVR